MYQRQVEGDLKSDAKRNDLAGFSGRKMAKSTLNRLNLHFYKVKTREKRVAV